MQWYKHYLADYQQDTADLTLIEHGAYRLLLDAYYQREGPLPSDLTILYRICHAHTRHERDAVRRVVERFTETLNGHLRVNRADKEIQQYQRQASANRDRDRDHSTGAFRAKNLERKIDITPLPPFDRDKPQPPKRKVCITCGQPAIEFMNYQWHCYEHLPYKTPTD